MMRLWRDEAQGKSLWAILALAGLFALALVLPGQAVVGRYVNDLLIFLDGAYRVNQGQVPNVDFSTALGPLNFYLPALAARITGTLGTAMPVAMAMVLVVLAPAIAHVISSRLRPVLGLPFAAFLLLIVAVPMNLGEAITDLSYGMFYNRIGWAALAGLILMHLRPTVARRHQGVLDALAATVLAAVMLYTKASYGLVAIAFLVLMLLDSKQRRWALAALCALAAIALAVEALWGGTAAHVGDLRAAMLVSGDRTLPEFVDFALRNLADYVLFLLLVGFSLWRTRSLRDALLYGFCAGAGLMLISQNFQGWGIITLHAGAVVAAERLVRTMTTEDLARPFSIPGAAPLLMLAFVLPTVVHCTAALALSTALSTARYGEPFGLRNYDGLRFAFIWNPGDAFANGRYLATLREGVAILSAMDPAPKGVFTLDFVNPFSSAANLAPPRGDPAWQHWGRNVNDYAFVPPGQLFRHVEVVMEPRVPIEGITGDNLRQIYGTYLAEHYEPVRETADWRVYRRSNPPPAVAESFTEDGVETTGSTQQ
jgi:hypothetical protein